MRFRLLSAVAVLALVSLVACGTPGAPQPPSLELARRVGDLKAARKADKISLTWTMPRETTERTSIKHVGVTRICRGVGIVAMPECVETLGTLQPTALGSAASFTDILGAQLTLQHATGFASYAVEVQNSRGRTAGLSNQVLVPLAPTLPAPTDLRAPVTPDGVELAWKGTEQPRDNRLRYFYRVYRRQQGAEKPVVAGEVELGTSAEGAMLDRGVEWEKNYIYRVTGVTVEPVQGKDEQIEGEDSPEIEVFVHDVFPPATPGGLQAVSSGVPQQPYIDLSWAPNTESDLAGYNVYRHEEGGAPVKISSEVVKTPTYRDTAVQTGHRYFYSVTAVDVRGNESGKSQEASEAVPQ